MATGRDGFQVDVNSRKGWWGILVLVLKLKKKQRSQNFELINHASFNFIIIFISTFEGFKVLTNLMVQTAYFWTH